MSKRQQVIEHAQGTIAGAVSARIEETPAVIETVTGIACEAVGDLIASGVPVLDAIADVAAGAARAAAGSSVQIRAAAEGGLVGALRGSGLHGEEALVAITHAAACFVQQTYDAGGDMTAAAEGLASGAAEAGQRAGLEAARAANAAAQSAFESAWDISPAAGLKIRRALTEEMEGVDITLRRALLAGRL